MPKEFPSDASKIFSVSASVRQKYKSKQGKTAKHFSPSLAILIEIDVHVCNPWSSQA